MYSSTRVETRGKSLRHSSLHPYGPMATQAGLLSTSAVLPKRRHWKATASHTGPSPRTRNESSKSGLFRQHSSTLSTLGTLRGQGSGASYCPETEKEWPQAYVPSASQTNDSIDQLLSFPQLTTFVRKLALSLGLSFVLVAALFLAPTRHRAPWPIPGCHVAAAMAQETKGAPSQHVAEVASGATLASMTQAHAEGGTAHVERVRSLSARVQYAFDTLLEKRPGTYILLLLTIVSSLVLFGGTLFSIATSKSDPFWDAWASLITSSTHLKEKSTEARAIGLLLTVGGLFFYSLLTSSLTAGFKQRMEWLKQGAHSPVVESGHIIVGGANLHLPTILRALDKQQEDAARPGVGKSRKGVVVIVTDQSKKEVDKMVTPLAKECSFLSILVRNGSTSKTSTFKRVGADSARSIILLATKDDPYDADAEAVSSVLALKSLVETNTQANVVVEVSKPSTGKLLENLCGLMVSPVEDLSAKLYVQCTRQPELLQVLQSFNPKNQMINLRLYPSLAGLPFGELRRGMQEAVVLGWIREGQVNFHPSDTDKLRADDTLLIVSPKGAFKSPPAELESKAKEGTATGATSRRSSFKPQGSKKEKLVPERILLLGWRRSVPGMLKEYAEYLGPGSEIVVLSNEPVKHREDATARVLEGPLKNITVVHKLGNPMSRKETEKAIFDKGSAFSRHMTPKNGKMVFEDVPFSVTAVSNTTWRSGETKTDKDTLYSVLLSKLICERKNVKVKNFTAEFQDPRVAKEAQTMVPSIRSICPSELLASLAATVSKDRELNLVWTELLNSWGNEFYLKDIGRYTAAGEAVTFAELEERALSNTEVAVGYRKDGKVVINPCPKNTPLSFSKGDSLVVVSETEIN